MYKNANVANSFLICLPYKFCQEMECGQQGFKLVGDSSNRLVFDSLPALTSLRGCFAAQSESSHRLARQEPETSSIFCH